MLHLEKLETTSQNAQQVELGIASISNQQFMFRLSPKQSLSPGFYVLSVTNGMFGGAVPLDCYLVETTPDEMLKASATAK
jgi:hypothetical protein